MAQLIDLTVTRRKQGSKDDTFATPVTYGFDVEDIVVPVRSINGKSGSYFTARQLKGTDHSSRQVGNTYYEVGETLTQIAAKSDLLVELIVTKRRNVDVANESYVFVTSRFSENIKESDTGGSKFFYQEDGDVNLVEYEVSETIAQIVTQSNVPAGGFIEVTYAEAQALVAACTLVEGEHYKITDRADLGIMLLATTLCSFSLEGEGVFLNPDFQGAGNYNGVIAYNSTLGVWTTAVDAAVVNGDIVFWNGLHYETTDATSVAGTDPSANILAYTLLAKAGTDFGYIEEVDFILYDFANDFIFTRFDKRRNKVQSKYAVDNFQWGNDSVTDNITRNTGSFDIINQRGQVIGCNIDQDCYMACDNTHEGFIQYTSFSGMGTWQTNFNATKGLYGCNIESFSSWTFDNTCGGLANGYEGKSIVGDYSDFPATLNMTNGVNYALATTTLTIPTSLNYVGIFNLINGSALTINQIVNLPTTHKSRFYVEAGSNQIFNHAAIGVAIANELVSDAAAANTITGRTNGSDFIEYERAGDLNRRYNAVILA